MFKVGPNPYGICTTLGIQGDSPYPKDADWFLRLAETMKARAIEFHFAHLTASPDSELDNMRGRLAEAQIEPVISGPWPLENIHRAVPVAKRLGAKTIRTHLSPVLCGSRADQGSRWTEMIRDIQLALPKLGHLFGEEGLILVIENHQDFGSTELLEFCDIGGEAVRICFDTGNPLAVGEAPLAFAERVSAKVGHVHLKDYRVQPTADGFRLVRCPIGEGAIPLLAIESILSRYHAELTATIEPGALEARHVRLLTDHWWQGYPSERRENVDQCIQATKRNSLPTESDYRTPFERKESLESICEFEMDQMMKSIENMTSLGWLPA